MRQLRRHEVGDADLAPLAPQAQVGGAPARDAEAEYQWRRARFDQLLYLRARGGSETLTDADLDSRIARELGTLRTLADELEAKAATRR